MSNPAPKEPPSCRVEPPCPEPLLPLRDGLTLYSRSFQSLLSPDLRKHQHMDNSSRNASNVFLPHVPRFPISSAPPASPSLTLRFVDEPQRSQTPNTHFQLTDEEEDACSAPQVLNQGHPKMAKEETMTPTTPISTPTTPSITATPTTPGTQRTPSTPTTPGTQRTPSTPITPCTPTSPVTPNSLSDFSRPSSSQFSRSTDLNSSFSEALSGICSPYTDLQM